MSGGSQGWIQQLLPGNHSQSDDCVDNADNSGVKTATYTANGINTCKILSTQTKAEQKVAIRTSKGSHFFIHLIAKPGPNLDVKTGFHTNISFNGGQSSVHNKSFDLRVPNPSVNIGNIEIEIWETPMRIGSLTSSRFMNHREDRGTLDIKLEIV